MDSADFYSRDTANDANLDDPDIQMTSETVDQDEEIDYDLVYALHTFVANLEGQVCVLKGDSLELLDDSNSYWWLVKCIKTDEIGYIPAENVETPFERLARLNRQKNIELSSPNEEELESDNFDESMAVKKNNSKGATVIFSENNLEIYEDDESDEETAVSYSGSIVETVVTAGAKKLDSTGKPKKNFFQPFQRFLGGYKKEKERLQNIETPFSSSNSVNVEQTVTEADVNEQEPINVLRIYAGNVDLKATFKTVALTKSMTVNELLTAALRRFRVPESSIQEYYLGVLHMDSQERKLPGTDYVLSILDSLRSKHLPGVRENRVSHAIGKQGRISSVRVNDNNIIRFIINKQLNIDKNFHLIRVILFDERDLTGKIRTYKTIGISNNTNSNYRAILKMKSTAYARDQEEKAINYYFVETQFNTYPKDIIRHDAEKISDILVHSEEISEEIEFILKREFISTSFSDELLVQSSYPTFDDQKSNPNVQNILQLKPNFLDHFPTNVNPNVPDEPPEYLTSPKIQKIEYLQKQDYHEENFDVSQRFSQTSMESASNPLKSNIQFMEEYLEEMLKEKANHQKVEALEAAMKQQQAISIKSPTPSHAHIHQSSVSSQQSKPFDPQDNLRQQDYNDHGLGDILSPSSPQIENASLPKRRLSARSSRSSLRDMYLELEADLDKSLSRVPSLRGRRESEATQQIQQLQQERNIEYVNMQSKRLSTSSLAPLNEGRKLQSPEVLQTVAESITESKTSIRDKRMSSMSIVDGAIAFESFAESETLVNNLQKVITFSILLVILN
ncbi:hypothetical protein HK096_004616 [Nowakowskiella sp. JEL0078]|nr:hypothetical protein HK096_004616 [Nowakowskiella sp. JEL0078]